MYLDTLKASLDKGVPELVLPGHGKYVEALELNITSFLAGEMSAKKALDDAAKKWIEINEDLGFDTQQFYYKELAKLMPP
jgi:glyoxylase-like metal-dependent hydrolase (beta-lactamase superfamily II)